MAQSDASDVAGESVQNLDENDAPLWCPQAQCPEYYTASMIVFLNMNYLQAGQGHVACSFSLRYCAAVLTQPSLAGPLTSSEPGTAIPGIRFTQVVRLLGFALPLEHQALAMEQEPQDMCLALRAADKCGRRPA